jgi:hypothetical protein
MTIMLCVLALGALLELGMQLVPFLWRARKILAPLSLLATAFACGGVAVWHLTVFSVLFGLVGAYRVFNLIRVLEERMHEHYLRRVTRRTTLVLLALQAVDAAAWWAWAQWHTSGHAAWAAVTAAQLGLTLVLLASTVRRLKRTAWPRTSGHLSDGELPTVSIAIPARNETADLEACLESIIACNYPKLEVLVLDDCSQTKRTPEIIRGYAHDGVRFIQGETPAETWLPKNRAYDRLAEEASGEFIIFCGVDVRFGTDSVRQLVAQALHKHKDMISVLPWRGDVADRRFALGQAVRYWWELVPPRRLFRRPPVLSTCWITRKSALKSVGGFVAVARSIVPEAHFARQLAKQDAYSFVRASQASGIQSVKVAREQFDTAIRTRYPQLHRRPENVLVTALLGFSLGLLPFVLAIAGFWLDIGWPAQLMAALAAAVLVAIYELVAINTRTGAWWSAPAGAVIGVLYDIGLLHVSMWQYEFSTVEWKGRNICVPAMHVVPYLPKLR